MDHREGLQAQPTAQGVHGPAPQNPPSPQTHNFL